jgi:hypothetical protein
MNGIGDTARISDRAAQVRWGKTCRDAGRTLNAGDAERRTSNVEL